MNTASLHFGNTSGKYRGPGRPLRICASLLTLVAVSAQADFLVREAQSEISSLNLQDDPDIAEVLHLQLGGNDCTWHELSSGEYATGTWTGPDTEPPDSWESGEHDCNFSWSQDGKGNLGSGGAVAYMRFDETWKDDEPHQVEIYGAQTTSLNRHFSSDAEEDLPDISVGSVGEYYLRFSIAQANTYVMRVNSLYLEHSASVTPDVAGSEMFGAALHFWLVSHTSTPSQDLLLFLPNQDGTNHVEATVQLQPGLYELYGTAVSGNGEWTHLMGDFFVQHEYQMVLAGCDITGTDQDDVLQGTSEDETICALEGDDMVDTGGGLDTVFLGAGDDQVNTDFVYAEGIRAYGGEGNDTIFGTDDADELYGDAGHDQIVAGDDDDYIRGGDGDDQIDGGAGEDEIYGEAGFDKIFGGDGDDSIWGGDKKDVIHGDDGNDLIAGEDGDDVLYGDDGNDYITGDNGRDIIDGGRGKDELYGGKANDVIYGGIGGDIMEGGQGHDAMYGGPNRDRIIGNSGNDVIEGGPGRDRIRGGPGDDAFDLADGEEDSVNCGSGNDDASNADDIVDTLVNCEVVPQ